MSIDTNLVDSKELKQSTVFGGLFGTSVINTARKVSYHQSQYFDIREGIYQVKEFPSRIWGVTYILSYHLQIMVI